MAVSGGLDSKHGVVLLIQIVSIDGLLLHGIKAIQLTS